MNKILSSRLLSKCTKEKLYTSFIRPIIMYACETLSTTQGDGKNCSILIGKFTDMFDFKMVDMREEKIKTWKCYLTSRILDYS